MACISPQPTFNGEFFTTGAVVNSGTHYMAIEPDYMGSIPLGQLRRMGRSVRMATGAAMPLLQQFRVDGIILGTTDGGMGDCHRFLDQIMEYAEGTLTPTNFVQGAPGAPAGGLALMTRNSGYNNTHSNKGLSFENALIDAQLLLNEGVVNQLLVGCVEEISDAQFNIERIAGYVKDVAGSAQELISSATPGTVNGEGAAMFIVNNEPSGAAVHVVDVATYSGDSMADLSLLIKELINRNGLKTEDVKVLLSGHNGDVRTDNMYSAGRDVLPHASVIPYKTLFGESPSASGFACWYAAQVMAGKCPPNGPITPSWTRDARHVLIHNHFQGQQHGLILLSKVD
jgi:3-oxoacyl-(acyl-carrier-protein) synthase